MIYAAILAGGTGTRMGNTDKPKQFMEISGKPVIVHTAEAFFGCEQIDKVLVVTPQEWVEYTREMLAAYFGMTTRLAVLAGGPTRNETLMNAIGYIDEEGHLDDGSIIVTQDAVRPFVTERMIIENIEAAQRTGACETAFPATDTIIESDDSKLVAKVPDRERLWMTQTPQSFRAKKLRELYINLTEDEKEVLTDAARIFVMKGEPVEIVRGESYNIKITYPQDVEIAEAILRSI